MNNLYATPPLLMTFTVIVLTDNDLLLSPIFWIKFQHSNYAQSAERFSYLNREISRIPLSNKKITARN